MNFLIRQVTPEGLVFFPTQKIPAYLNYCISRALGQRKNLLTHHPTKGATTKGNMEG